MAIELDKRLFTVDEYYRMAEAGILAEDDRVELIEGEIIWMSPIGSRHAGCVKRLVGVFTSLLGKSVVVSVQDPVRLSDRSEPEPDVALLKPREDYYSNGHPGPTDVLLIVEVADTTQFKDRAVKIPLYARAGIPEAWLVNLTNDTIEVYSKPQSGQYQTSAVVGRGETVISGIIPQLSLRVEEILG